VVPFHPYLFVLPVFVSSYGYLMVREYIKLSVFGMLTREIDQMYLYNIGRAKIPNHKHQIKPLPDLRGCVEAAANPQLKRIATETS